MEHPCKGVFGVSDNTNVPAASFCSGLSFRTHLSGTSYVRTLRGGPGAAPQCHQSLRFLPGDWPAQHSRIALPPARTVAESMTSWKTGSQALTFIIRNIPQRCVAGITFVFAFVETSFNPALWKKERKIAKLQNCCWQEHRWCLQTAWMPVNFHLRSAVTGTGFYKRLHMNRLPGSVKAKWQSEAPLE